MATALQSPAAPRKASPPLAASAPTSLSVRGAGAGNPYDPKLAKKALKLLRSGLKGKAIGIELGVSTQEANVLASVGRAHEEIDSARLTPAEISLLKALAAIQRERLAKGETATPKSWMVSARCRKSDSWCAATANKRMFEERWSEKLRRNVRGLGFVHASPNGHIWMLPAGWALIHAMEAQAQ